MVFFLGMLVDSYENKQGCNNEVEKPTSLAEQYTTRTMQPRHTTINDNVTMQTKTCDDLQINNRIIHVQHQHQKQTNKNVQRWIEHEELRQYDEDCHEQKLLDQEFGQFQVHIFSFCFVYCVIFVVVSARHCY